MSRLQNAVGIFGLYQPQERVEHAKHIGKLTTLSKSIKNQMQQSGFTRNAKAVVHQHKLAQQKFAKRLTKLSQEIADLLYNVEMSAPPNSNDFFEERGDEHFGVLQGAGRNITDISNDAEQSELVSTEKKAIRKAMLTYKSVYRSLYDGASIYEPYVTTLLSQWQKDVDSVVAKLR
jgi:hypothetical protein